MATAARPTLVAVGDDRDLVDQAEFYRLDAARFLTDVQRAELGQFLTPAPVGRFMASLSQPAIGDIRLLDPGAGVGTLSAAWIEDILARKKRPRSIHLTVCEIDPELSKYLRQTIMACQAACRGCGVGFRADVIEQDFVTTAIEWLAPQPLFDEPSTHFDCAILNPPYRKINSDSATRHALRQVEIETSNLYTAFLWLVLKLLTPTGELVAITPRSFCNGPYFQPFREALLSKAHLSRVHVFESRKTAFREDAVLQENIIFRAGRGEGTSEPIVISTSEGPDDPDITFREVSSEELVPPNEPGRVIHLAPNELQGQVARRIRAFTATLPDLGIQVSTGRVVDFRAKEYLVRDAEPHSGDTAPLIYPVHFEGGEITWPKPGKKPNHLRTVPETEDLLVPPGIYVLVKRFSAKEEKRRVSAALCKPERLPNIGFAFENHLNYYHAKGNGLKPDLAEGLAVYLNSSLVDSYFRQFSGHTQVNASDLRNLPYPDRAKLERIGRAARDLPPSQETFDQLIAKELSDVAKDSLDPLNARKRIDEALAIIKVLGLPRAQQNVRSALTLLALTDIKPQTKWSKASSPLMGITPIMEFAKEYYGTIYAPNTRETFRRLTMHQFVEAGISLYNPDQPDRPVNSPRAVYQIAPLLLDVLRSYGTKKWDRLLRDWLASVETLKVRYARAREMAKIPLKLPTGEQIELSPGGQNVLIEQIIHEFCPRFTPGGIPIYIGDTEEKYAYFNKDALDALGGEVDPHGKMPDVVIHHVEKNWLVLIEAVTSHGPVDGKRRDELKRLLAQSSVPLVYVTAFMDRSAMVRFLGDISWETEVWVAEAPSHMIHFNGERFLGPYED